MPFIFDQAFNPHWLLDNGLSQFTPLELCLGPSDLDLRRERASLPIESSDGADGRRTISV